ncbi:hypothetical protein L9F63_003332, partial [Diploptera punctata]
KHGPIGQRSALKIESCTASDKKITSPFAQKFATKIASGENADANDQSYRETKCTQKQYERIQRCSP